MTRQYPFFRVITRSLPLAVLTIAFLLLTAHCSLLTVAAQSATATLSGTVEDQNGAAIPGVGITVVNKGTQLKREATTNDEGNFTIPLLPPGGYTVRAQGQGFAPAEFTSVVLNVGDQKTLKIELKAGDINAEVQVVSEAPLINTSPAVATTVDRQFVGNMPLNGRSFQSLITLTPGVVLVPTFRDTTGQFSVNGQRANANIFMIDGVSANVGNGVASVTVGQAASGTLPGLTAFGTTQSLVAVDALQEFKIQTSNYSAEFGRSPGAQISLATRSGANDFHGSAFDYVRNEKFDANDWFSNKFGIKRQPMRQNDFGGTFSGPVMLPRFGEGGKTYWTGRNRTFFFFSYEALRLRTPQFVLTTVPSLALRQSAPEGLRPILNALPIPNGPEVAPGRSQFATGFSDASSLNATSVRIDHTVNSNLTLFGRYSDTSSEARTRNPGNVSQWNFRASDAKSLTLGATMIFSPKVNNELRVNYTDNAGTAGLERDTFGGAIPVSRELLIPTQIAPFGTSASAAISFFFSGGSAGGVNFGSRGSSQRQVNIVNSTSLNVGAHQLKFGIDYRRLMPILAPEKYQLFVSYSSQQAILNNQSGFVSISARQQAKPIYTNFSAFAQDTWQASRRLTLDLGLRWELNPPPTEADGNDPFTVIGLDNLSTMQVAPQGTPLWKTTYANFAPRFGLAYLLREAAGSETVIRGGIGVFYDTGNSQASAGFNGAPFVVSRFVSGLSFPLDPAVVAPPPFSLSPPFESGIFPFDPNLKLPYTLQWNLAVEQSLGKSQTFSGSYVGNAGRRLLFQTRRFGDFVNFFDVFPTYNGATSDYNAMQLQFERRLSKGLQALASYTWSHAIDEVSQDSQAFDDSFMLLRGSSDFDIRHVFSAAVTYDIPSTRSPKAIHALLSNWSLDTRVYAHSAPPVEISVRNLFDLATGSVTRVRANLIPGVPLYIDDPSVPGGRRINGAAFSVPPRPQQGNLGRNVLRAFGAWQADVALRRQFNIGEKLKLQLRVEAFNVFNHPNFAGFFNEDPSSPIFGQALNTLGRQLGGLDSLYQIGGPRSLQFSLKLIY